MIQYHILCCNVSHKISDPSKRWQVDQVDGTLPSKFTFDQLRIYKEATLSHDPQSLIGCLLMNLLHSVIGHHLDFSTSATRTCLFPSLTPSFLPHSSLVRHHTGPFGLPWFFHVLPFLISSLSNNALQIEQARQ